MKPLFFLSHPRQGNIEENLKEAHRLAQNELKDFNLIEPFIEIPQDGSVNEFDAMKRCIELLLGCDGIILTGNWRKSEGCRLEFAIARATGKRILEML